jgi:ketosteroid isomerase-like protein
VIGSVVLIELAWAEQFARAWCADWNSHDLDRIVAHYTADVEWASPVAERMTGSARIAGRDALRAYFDSGLQLLPDLHFTVESVRAGIDAVVIDYRNERGQAVSEVLTIRDGLVAAGFGAYGAVPDPARQ